MFDHLRIQVVQPCRARCTWCATHLKNPLFAQLNTMGVADLIHDFYVEAIRYFRPREVFISGGEPLLHPRFGALLTAIKDHTERIHIFTSYQWSVEEREAMPLAQMPLSKIVFNHTPIYFDPTRWDALTGECFPFSVYLDNIRYFGQLEARKRFKFIINHEDCVEELRRFHQMVEPDKRFQLSLKVLNDQGDGLGREQMKRTATLIHQRARELDDIAQQAGWGKVGRKMGSIDQMSPLLESGDVSRCGYRQRAIELRFALDRKARNGRPVLRYRYCPYFPPRSGHRFHIGRDELSRIEHNYRKGSYRKDCHACRFLAYCTSEARTRETKDVG
ncbi:MAG: radical SAM protein [Deltaproteobacteria bacterium]|nr:radical SAM protein [Deltaproteobacteria bacterium]